MGKMAIDLDRGVTMRQIVKFNGLTKFEPDPQYGGLAVYMYKDEPGVYYNAHGKKVSDALAEKAGFPVGKLAKQRLHKERLAEFERKLAEELQTDLGEEIVLAQKGGWKVVALPAERANVIDLETGEAVNGMPMFKNDALKLLGSLTEDVEEATIPAGSKK